MAIFITPPGTGGGGSTSPGGSDTQIQFNDGGAFGGDVDLTYDKTTNLLTTKGDIKLDDSGAYTTTLQCITPTANRTISFPDAPGTVALVGGSSGQAIYNNGGALAGISTMTFDGTSVTLAGRLINSYNSASLAPAEVFTGTWATGFGATNTKPHFLIEPTGTSSGAWSPNGTGLGVNAASTFSGRLIDLQLNGSSYFHYGVGTSTSTGLQFGEGPSVSATNAFNGRLLLHASYSLGWSSGSSGLSTNLDLALARDAANTLAQRNGTNAQTFRVYNTYTSATNYELGKLEWSGNVFRIGTEKGSGGGTARNLELQTDGTTRATISSTGDLGVGTTPLVKFDVKGATDAHVGLTATGSGESLILAFNDAGQRNPNLSYAANSHKFLITTTERAQIDSSGRLLIGTATNTGGSLLQINDNRIRIATSKTPASAADTGAQGEICWDSDYIYVCTATNTWKRAALATW